LYDNLQAACKIPAKFLQNDEWSYYFKLTIVTCFILSKFNSIGKKNNVYEHNCL